MKQIIVPLVIAFLVLIGTAYINTKIKFAPTEKAARQAIDILVANALAIAASLYSLWVIYQQATSPEPVTRWAVVVIALNFFSLGVIIWSVLLLRVITSFKSALSALNALLNK